MPSRLSDVPAGAERQHELQAEGPPSARARARSESAELGALRAELAGARAELQRDREEGQERVQRANRDAKERGGELDVARSRLAAAEAASIAARDGGGDGAQARVGALEMELGLVRARLAREAAARQLAEGDAAEAEAKLRSAEADVERSAAENRRLRAALAERGELAEFRKEIIDDLGMRFKEQSADAERRLQLERGKIAVARRLESILPKPILAKAFG